MQQRVPSVWCLLGKKAGDNTQVRALAEELGWGYEEKHITARPWELVTHLGHRVTLAGIDQSMSTPLEGPWPDLVITAGRRNESVARWIKQCAGGMTRLVLIGRPWSPLSVWDLIVTTPQYCLPDQPGIVRNSLPLYRFPATEQNRAAVALAPRLKGLPRPWIAVLLGGNSGKFVFTRAKGADMGILASSLAGRAGGSLLVSDSPRTPAAAGDSMAGALRAPNFCYRCGDPGDNPYRGLLALADAFIVTGESMSMLGEAAAMGKPLFIYDLSDNSGYWWLRFHNYRYRPLSHRLAMVLGPRRMRRDISKIQRGLVDSGRASWLTGANIARAATTLGSAQRQDPAVPATAGEELRRSAAAVRRLFLPR